MKNFYSILKNSVSVMALCCLATPASALDVATEQEFRDALYEGNDDIRLLKDMNITTALLHLGTGNFLIDGDNHQLSAQKVRGMIVGEPVTIRLSNITMKGFKHAVINQGTIEKIVNSQFIGNRVEEISQDAQGGAIRNEHAGVIKNISNTVFKDNLVLSKNGYAYGGAIANITNSAMTITNTSFFNNSAMAITEENKDGSSQGGDGPVEIDPNQGKGGGAGDGTGGETPPSGETPSTGVTQKAARGGAIYSKGDLNIVAQGKDVVFKGNTENNTYTKQTNDSAETTDPQELLPARISNAISMDGGNLKFEANDGNIYVDDGISAANGTYDLTVGGTGDIYLNGEVTGVENLNVNSNNLYLGEKSKLKVKNYNVNPDVALNVTVNPKTMTASKLEIEGDVVGTHKVVVNVTSEEKVDTTKSVLFVTAKNDNKETLGNFVVYRVYGSPFLWTSKYKEFNEEKPEDGSGIPSEGASLKAGDGTGENGEEPVVTETKNGWYLSMTNELNPDFRPMAPEIASYLSMHSIAVEQNKDVTKNIRNAVASDKFVINRYGVLYEDGYRGRAVSKVWINPVYRHTELTLPQELEAEISGFDAGVDLQADASNKLGAFASYRYGTYDIGQDGYFKANMDSTIEVESYLLGLYYRYDYNNFWMFSTAYAGTQEAKIETDDLVKTRGDGAEYGAGMELGYAYIPGQNWTLEPSLGIFYSGVNYDDMKDKYGKSAEYSMLHHFEGEFGIKVEKTIFSDNGYSKVYIKPSVIQSFNIGNDVKITHLGKLDTLDDITLGRIELGGRYLINKKFNLYGYVNYTTGSDYDDITTSFGINYHWY